MGLTIGSFKQGSTSVPNMAGYFEKEPNSKKIRQKTPSKGKTQGPTKGL